MATYEYRCKSCNGKYSKIMTFTEHERKPKPACPDCKSRKVEQLPVNFQVVTSKKA